jgi:hypothetical protein
MFKSFFGNNKEIKFLCNEEDWDVIPKPYLSKKYMPDWYKALPMYVDNQEKFKSSTIKRCNPFFDAMAAGYIIPSAADVYFETNEDASYINFEWQFHKTMIETHGKKQITNKKNPNPNGNFPPLKFMNYWLVQTPPGWSTLFINPINRQDPRLSFIGGFVDTDKYFENINFPFFFTEPNFSGIIKQGTPLVQAIPIKRSELLNTNDIRKFTEKEFENLQKTRKKMAAKQSLYRDTLVEKK